MDQPSRRLNFEEFALEDVRAALAESGSPPTATNADIGGPLACVKNAGPDPPVDGLAYAPGSSDSLVTLVANVLRTSGWEIRPALRALLLSTEFRSGDAATSTLARISPLATSATARA